MSARELHSGEQLIVDLQEWASEYAQNSDGRLEVLPYDPHTYKGQDGFYVPGQPSHHSLVDLVAQQAQERYAELYEQLEESEDKTGRVAMIGRLLEDDKSVQVITNHGDLIDVAVAHAALYSMLQKQGYPAKTGIIISKMVAFLAYKLGDDPTPCTDALQILETETYLSYPKSDSAKKHLKNRFLATEVDKHNKAMRKRVVHQLGEGGLLLAMAASGSTDKPTPEDPATTVMHRVGEGTARLLQTEHTYVVPMAIWYQSEKPVLEVCDIPRFMTSDATVHSGMVRLADTLTAQVPERSFVYEG